MAFNRKLAGKMTLARTISTPEMKLANRAIVRGARDGSALNNAKYNIAGRPAIG